MVALDAPFVGTESWRGAAYRASAVDRCSGVTTVDSKMVPLGRCSRELRSGLVDQTLSTKVASPVFIGLHIGFHWAGGSSKRGCITIELSRTV